MGKSGTSSTTPTKMWATKVGGGAKVHVTEERTEARKPSPRQSTGHHLYRAVTQFCAETAVHGLGQVARHVVPLAKVVWLVAFLGTVAGNFYHISTLVTQYRDFKVQESTTLEQKPVIFPAVTVCNMNAISRSNLEVQLSNKFSLTSEYLNRLERMRASGLLDDMEYATLTNPTHLAMNIGTDEAGQIGHTLRDMVLRCEFRGRECNLTTDFKSVLNAEMMNCYTFDPGEKANDFLATGPENGLSLLFYLESTSGRDTQGSQYMNYSGESNIANSVGMKVKIHPQGEYPQMDVYGMDMMPGHSTAVGFKVEDVLRLPDPYGNCTSNITLAGVSGYRYSPIPCLNTCLQDRIIDLCGCASIYHPVPDYFKGGAFCGTLNGNLTDDEALKMLEEQVSCGVKTTTEFGQTPGQADACGCYLRCEDVVYGYEVTESKWPAPKYYNGFLQQEILDRVDMRELKVYQELGTVIEDVVSPATPESNVDFIPENFARLNVFMRDMEVTKRKQTASYLLARLFSDVGGTLGLWVGLSLITLLELLQLSVRMGLICTGKTNTD